MAKVISQETYDEAIKENIVEFSMSVEESREETVQQFSAQGVNLANIIKDLTINEKTGQPVLNEIANCLKNHAERTQVMEPQELEKQLDILTADLNKSVAHRVVAAQKAHEFILKIIQDETEIDSNGKCNISVRIVVIVYK